MNGLQVITIGASVSFRTGPDLTTVYQVNGEMLCGTARYLLLVRPAADRMDPRMVVQDTFVTIVDTSQESLWEAQSA